MSREPLLNALAELAAELGCQGSILGEPALPEAKEFGLNEILWNQIMMGDNESISLSLALGADLDYQVKGKGILQLARAMSSVYNTTEAVEILKAYGAKDKPKKPAPKSS